MALVFDFDGVIVNTMRSNIDAINAFSTRYDFEPMTEATYVGMLDANFTEYWQMLLGKQSHEFMRDLHHYPRPHPVIIPGVRDILATHRPAIVSSNHSTLIREVLRQHNLELPIYGIDYDPSKVRKLGKLKRDPDLFVTDTTGDIAEGKTAGYVVIAVTWGFMPVEKLERARPNRIVHTPDELRHAISALTVGNV